MNEAMYRYLYVYIHVYAKCYTAFWSDRPVVRAASVLAAAARQDGAVYSTSGARNTTTVDSKKLEHRCRVICAGSASFFGWRLEDGHVPTFWLLLYGRGVAGLRLVLRLV